MQEVKVLLRCRAHAFPAAVVAMLVSVSFSNGDEDKFLAPRRLLVARCSGDFSFDQSYGVAFWWDCAAECPVPGYATAGCKCACVKPESVTDPPPTAPPTTTSLTTTTYSFDVNDPFGFDRDNGATTGTTTTRHDASTDGTNGAANGPDTTFGSGNNENSNATDGIMQTTTTTTTTTPATVTSSVSALVPTTKTMTINASVADGKEIVLVIETGATTTTRLADYGPSGTRVPLTNLGKPLAKNPTGTLDDGGLSIYAIIAIVGVASCAVFVPVVVACLCRPSGSVQPIEVQSTPKKTTKVSFDPNPPTNAAVPMPEQVVSSVAPPPPLPFGMPKAVPPPPLNIPKVGPPAPGVPSGMLTPKGYGLPDAQNLNNAQNANSGMRTPIGTPRTAGNNGTPRTSGNNGTPRQGNSGVPRSDTGIRTPAMGSSPRTSGAVGIRTPPQGSSPRVPTGLRSASMAGSMVPPPPPMPGRPSLPPPSRPPPPGIRSQMSNR